VAKAIFIKIAGKNNNYGLATCVFIEIGTGDQQEIVKIEGRSASARWQ
jgi:hypothetical protein